MCICVKILVLLVDGIILSYAGVTYRCDVMDQVHGIICTAVVMIVVAHFPFNLVYVSDKKKKTPML